LKITQTGLSNKLRVLSTEIPDSQSVAISIFVGAGSRYESKDINGLSHFLEHLSHEPGDLTFD
jgi:predicted Zn-dependent peptidase